MRILACGSRTWTDSDYIGKILDEYPGEDHVLIHGAAKGADWLCAVEAANRHWDVKSFPADWSKGRAAGIVRNESMLDEKPDLVLAFWDGSSKGTLHTITSAKRRGIEVRTFLAPEGFRREHGSPS
jgi:hypothetical protein